MPHSSSLPGLRKCLPVLLLFDVLLFSTITASAAQAPYGVDLSGRPVLRLADSQTKVVVLLFIATDCPVSNRYVPQIRRLQAEFEPQHVAFWVIYPNPADTSVAIRQHQQDFGKIAAEIRDPDHALVQLAHAKITPEAAVLLPDKSGFHEVYVGRIDNRYIDFGRQRPHATQHDLQDAIQAALRGSAVIHPSERPVGCYIVN
ncbi:MAG TPA: redoxin domain-containing protein [Acidobacteriaceae bacterium]|nr:redoxin domain-containing protein [Acidobacteriaceae bacterium]